MGKQKKARLRVEEYDHAYLVRGTNVVHEAKLALFEHLGRKKWKRIERMPARPLNAVELGEAPQSCVGLYFAIAEGAPRKYKP